ncbi:MAG: hypothetical protein WDW38_007937 [Sanguina aurantia]
MRQRLLPFHPHTPSPSCAQVCAREGWGGGHRSAPGAFRVRSPVPPHLDHPRQPEGVVPLASDNPQPLIEGLCQALGGPTLDHSGKQPAALRGPRHPPPPNVHARGGDARTVPRGDGLPGVGKGADAAGGSCPPPATTAACMAAQRGSLAPGVCAFTSDGSWLCCSVSADDSMISYRLIRDRMAWIRPIAQEGQAEA